MPRNDGHVQLKPGMSGRRELGQGHVAQVREGAGVSRKHPSKERSHQNSVFFKDQSFMERILEFLNLKQFSYSKSKLGEG